MIGVFRVRTTPSKGAVEWPDKATHDVAWPKIMEDKRIQPDRDTMPFDGQRMFWGSFRPILDA